MNHIIANQNKLNYAYYLKNGEYLNGKPFYDVWGNGVMLCSNQTPDEIKTWKAKCKREKIAVEITEIPTHYVYNPIPSTNNDFPF